MYRVYIPNYILCDPENIVGCDVFEEVHHEDVDLVTLRYHFEQFVSGRVVQHLDIDLLQDNIYDGSDTDRMGAMDDYIINYLIPSIVYLVHRSARDYLEYHWIDKVPHGYVIHFLKQARGGKCIS